MKKLVLTQKQIISTSEQCVEHQFADQNTQQTAMTKSDNKNTHKDEKEKLRILMIVE